jgi:outer membrane lipoprotein-sorting protein
MKRTVYIICLLFSIQSSADTIDSIIHNFAVESIDATIVQVIAETGKPTIRYEGRYRAHKQNMRIDYSKPFPQIVIVKEGNLEWYYPQSKELWVMQNISAPVTHPSAQFIAFKDRIVIKSKENTFYGFFKRAYRYILEDSITKTIIELIVDAQKGYPVKKITSTADNVEIMREQYEDYKYIHNIWFPTTVEVIARTHTGTTRNVTRYYNVHLNVKVPPDIFTLQLPKGVTVKHM